MTAVQKLVDYISNLTPEQADKIIDQLPKLLEGDAELFQLFLQAQSKQTQ